MKRYFDISEQRLALELDIEDGSVAETADVSLFEKQFNTKMSEVTKGEYEHLVKKYTNNH